MFGSGTSIRAIEHRLSRSRSVSVTNAGASANKSGKSNTNVRNLSRGSASIFGTDRSSYTEQDGQSLLGTTTEATTVGSEVDSRYMTARDIVGTYVGDDSDDGQEEDDEGMIIKARIDEDVSKEVRDRTQKWLALPRDFMVKMPKTHLRPHHDKLTISANITFQLLLSKNLKIFCRQKCSSLLEILIPILTIAALTVYVSTFPVPDSKPLMYPSFNLTDTHNATFMNCENFMYVSESNTITGLIMNTVKENLRKYINKDFQLIYEPKVEVATSKKARHSVCAVIVFDERHWKTKNPNPSIPDKLSYQIRQPATHDQILSTEEAFYFARDSWFTKYIFSPRIKTVARNRKNIHGGDPGYFKEGFILLQYLINDAIMKTIFEKNQEVLRDAGSTPLAIDYETHIKDIVVKLQRFPVKAYLTSDKLEVLHEDLAFFLTLTLFFPVMMFLRELLIEKENNLRIQLSSHCVSLSLQNIGWLMRGLIVHSVIAAIITFIVSVKWNGDSLLGNTNSIIFFIFLISIVWNGLCFACLLGTIFHRVTTGIFVFLILWMMTFAFYFFLSSNYKALSFFSKFFGCCLSQLGVVLGLHVISEYESENIGVNFSNLFSVNQFTLGWAIVSLILHGFVYLGISVYTECILSEQGQLLYPLMFFKERWYWRGEMPPDTVEPDDHGKTFEEVHPEHFEDESKKRRRKELEILNVSKYFGDIKVLKNISLTCFYGHVNLLMAQATEGKSTLVSLINGMCTATSGDILVNAISMNKERRLAQTFIGHCPQMTSLCFSLTVEETLVFYAKLKGMNNTMEIVEEVERMMSNSFLTEFRSCLVSELTITSQRLLMITTAFCGGSRVVLLDNPTEGMDACQKRVCWEFIMKEKTHRTILACASNMDEADTCVDKVFILCRGQIQCRGTPKFILSRLGGGYFLTLKKGPKFNDAVVKSAIEEVVPGTQFTETEETICFNMQSDESSRFPMLFDELEIDEFLGISDIQLSYVSLDEVHNRLYMHTEVEELENDTEREKTFRDAITYPIIPNKVMTKYELMRYQLFHLILKNVRFHTRRHAQFWAATLVPLLAVAIPCTIFTFLHPFEFTPLALKMDLSQTEYGNPVLFLDCSAKIKPLPALYMCNRVKECMMKNFPNVIVKDEEHLVEAMLGSIGDNSANTLNRKNMPLLALKIYGSDQSSNGQGSEVIGYFNNFGHHLLPVIVIMIDNLRIAFLASRFQDAVRSKSISIPNNYSFHVVNNPLPIQPWDKITASEGLINPGFVACFCASLGLCTFLSTVSIMYVKEKSFKHYQIMSGVHLGLFWMSNYLWNIVHYTVEICMIVGVLLVSDVGEFNDNTGIHLFLMLFISGSCCILMIAAGSVYRHSHAGLAFSRTLMFLVLTGPGLLIAITTWRHSIWYRLNKTSLKIAHRIFLIFPSYALASGIFYIYLNGVHKSECKELKDSFNESCLKPKAILLPGQSLHESCCLLFQHDQFSIHGYGIGSNLIYLVVETILIIMLMAFLESDRYRLLVIKYHDWQRKKWKIVRPHQTDLQDLVVVDEAAAALGMKKEESHFGLCIRDLCKEYPYSTPVDCLNLFIMNGEVFGLLGERHSDKDELIYLLTGTLEPTRGDVFFNRKTLMEDNREYLRQIGYCPYECPFLGELTGRETMLLIGSLKGTRPESMEGIMSNLALKLFILHDLSNQISKYSNAVARKFTAACAMLGDPRLCIFDEPSVGIDPESRFYLWNCIRSLAKGGCTIIISSHNMEECQDFCTKVGMFINGKIRCMGTVPELKARHSIGYAVVVRFNPTFNERHFTTVEDSHRRAKVQGELVATNENRLQTRVPIDDYATVRRKLGLPAEIDENSDADVQAFLDYRAQVAHDLGSLNSTADIIKAIRPEDLCHWEKDLLPFMRYFEKRIPCSLVDIQPNFLFYHIDKDVCRWSDIFTTMEESKLLDWTNSIESYYVGETSLEQMVLNYIRGQQPKGESTL